jgi:gluconate 2-dehydrogenase gamma chain
MGIGWLAASWPAVVAAHAHAASAATAPAAQRMRFLTPDEARVVAAIADQIVPRDDMPGALEAGAPYFIDQSLHTWAAKSASDFRDGLRDFEARFTSQHPSLRFDAADDATQIAFLTAVEETPFFGLVRLLTLLGMFSLPAYGGNRGGAGWRLLGFKDNHAFSPPFGYYDRDYPGFTLPKAPA